MMVCSVSPWGKKWVYAVPSVIGLLGLLGDNILEDHAAGQGDLLAGHGLVDRKRRRGRLLEDPAEALAALLLLLGLRGVEQDGRSGPVSTQYCCSFRS